MFNTIHKITLTAVTLFVGGFIMTQPVSADTFTVHNADSINIDFDRKTVKIGRMTYPYELSDKEVATLQHFRGSETNLTVTTNKHHIVTTVKQHKVQRLYFGRFKSPWTALLGVLGTGLLVILCACMWAVALR